MKTKLCIDQALFTRLIDHYITLYKVNYSTVLKLIIRDYYCQSADESTVFYHNNFSVFRIASEFLHGPLTWFEVQSNAVVTTPV